LHNLFRKTATITKRKLAVHAADRQSLSTAPVAHYVRSYTSQSPP